MGNAHDGAQSPATDGLTVRDYIAESAECFAVTIATLTQIAMGHQVMGRHQLSASYMGRASRLLVDLGESVGNVEAVQMVNAKSNDIKQWTDTQLLAKAQAAAINEAERILGQRTA